MEALLHRLEGVRRSGRGYVARCPAHSDKTPSLAIGLGEGGRILVFCHAACDTKDVLEAVGLGWADLFPDGPQRPKPMASAAAGRAVGLIFLPSTDWPDWEQIVASLRLDRARR